MKRSKSTGRRDSRSSAGKSARTGQKRSFSKKPADKRDGGGEKPFRRESSTSESGGRFKEGSVRSSDRFKRDDKPRERNFSDRKEGKPQERSYGRSRIGSAGEENRDRKFTGNGEDKPRERTFGKSSDRVRPSQDRERPAQDRERKPFRSRESSAGSKSFSRPEREYDSNEEKKPRNTDRPPFRKKISSDRAEGPDHKKRKRIGEKSSSRSEEKEPRSRLKSSHSSHKNDSPRAFGENKFQKRSDEKGKRTERRSASVRKTSWNRKEDSRFSRDKRKPIVAQQNDDGTVRLNKYIANAGICSRREADELIAAGVVSVNGVAITEMGYKVMPEDVVKYNNEQLRSERLVYILLNKPKDFITTTDDPEDRKTVMNLIAKACKERVYPVGRLDRNTTGVLLFTNDGDLAKKLTHPSFQVHKVYQAELDSAVKSTDLDQIKEGVKLDDGFIKADEVVYASADKKVIGMELHSGKNRIVRRIFEHLGYEVKKLDRVVFGGLTKKDLPRGRWRFLTEMEVANLKMVTGNRKA